jgi:hypothetical protein
MLHLWLRAITSSSLSAALRILGTSRQAKWQAVQASQVCLVASSRQIFPPLSSQGLASTYLMLWALDTAKIQPAGNQPFKHVQRERRATFRKCPRMTLELPILSCEAQNNFSDYVCSTPAAKLRA